MMGLICAKRKPFVDKKVHHQGMYFYGTRKNSILIFFDKVLVSGYPKCLYVSESLECDLSSEKFCDVSPVHGGARQAFKKGTGKGTGKCPARKSDHNF